MTLKPILSGAALAALCALALPAAAQQFVFTTVLSGSAEEPPNTSPAGGAAIVTFDTTASSMRLQTTWANLTGDWPVGHVHCCTSTALSGLAPPATALPTLPGFPTGARHARYGSYDQTLDMTQSASYSPEFLAANGGSPDAAFDTLLGGVGSGQAYFNIHSTAYPTGEIRGFLQPVPEPATYALMLGGLALLGSMARRRRDHAA